MLPCKSAEEIWRAVSGFLPLWFHFYFYALQSWGRFFGQTIQTGENPFLSWVSFFCQQTIFWQTNVYSSLVVGYLLLNLFPVHEISERNAERRIVAQTEELKQFIRDILPRSGKPHSALVKHLDNVLVATGASFPVKIWIEKKCWRFFPGEMEGGKPVVLHDDSGENHFGDTSLDPPSLHLTSFAHSSVDADLHPFLHHILVDSALVAAMRHSFERSSGSVFSSRGHGNCKFKDLEPFFLFFFTAERPG